MRTLILGYAKGFLTMFIKKKKNRSGTTSIVVAEKTKGSYKELVTIGVAKDANDIDSLVNAGREWISKEESRRHPQLDLYGEEREACDREREEVRRVLSNVSNILLNGCDLILDRTFDRIGFNRIDDEVFRKLVKARLACRTSFPYCKIKDRDTPNVSFYTQTHRSSYMHLLCGFESLQGIGAHVESLRDQDERRQGAGIG